MNPATDARTGRRQGQGRAAACTKDGVSEDQLAEWLDETLMGWACGKSDLSPEDFARLTKIVPDMAQTIRERTHLLDRAKVQFALEAESPSKDTFEARVGITLPSAGQFFDAVRSYQNSHRAAPTPIPITACHNGLPVGRFVHAILNLVLPCLFSRG